LKLVGISSRLTSILLSFSAESGSGLGYLCGIFDLHIIIVGAVSPVLLCISVCSFFGLLPFFIQSTNWWASCILPFDEGNP